MAVALTRRNFLRFDFGDRSAEGDHLVRVHRAAMACRFEVALCSEDAAGIPAARAALDEADRLEQMLSVFRDTSDVAEMNRRAASEAVTVHPDLFALLMASRHLHARTEGAFDVTSTPLSRCWGFMLRDGCVPDEAELARARSVVGMSYVQLDDTSSTVRFAREGVEVSFGAIGKGYALDLMATRLRVHRIRRALISAGHSSVLALGGSGRGWPIDVRPRLANRIVGRLWLTEGAVGTSGAGEQFFEIDGERYGHVIDPRSGRPARGVLGVTVVTSTAASADALSTAFLIGGPDLARRYCGAGAHTLAVFVLDEPGDRTEVVGGYGAAALEMVP